MLFKGTIKGSDKGTAKGRTKDWTGEVSLRIDGKNVSGTIEWTSEKGHNGTDYVEGELSSDRGDLKLESTRAANHVPRPRIVKCTYKGTLTTNGQIDVEWGSRYGGGQASGKVVNQTRP